MSTIKRKQKLLTVIAIIFIICLVLPLSGSVFASSPEMSWENIDFAKSINFRDIVQNDSGLYVVVGDEGTIKLSNDLNTWKLQSSGTKNNLFGCAWGNGKFVAVGTKGTILYSDNGSKWYKSEIDSRLSLYGIAWGNGKFIAIGLEEPKNGSKEKQIILSSDDGRQWKKVDEKTDDYSMREIVFTNNTFFALGFNKYMISKDGVTWKANDMQEDKSINDIFWDGKQYVAVCNNSMICVSNDAMQWTPVKNNIKEGLFLYKIALYNNKYVLILEEGSICYILVSPDLSTWEDASKRGYSEISKMIISNGKLIAAGWHNTILQTEDGSTWNVTENYSPNILKIIWNGKQFLAIGNNGTTYISKDGMRWSSNSIESEGSIVDVVWTGKEYVALSETFDNNPDSYDILKSDLYTSFDGIKWTCVGSIDQKNIDKLFYLDNRFFALGREGQILVSSDAKRWVATKTNTTNWLRGLAWNGKKFVSVGMYGTIITSLDGINWSTQVSKCNSDLNNVIWNGRTFALVGAWKTFSSSKDGENWKTTTSTTDCTLENIIWDGQKFLLFENTGEIYSTDGLKRPTLLTSTSMSSPESIAWNGECYVMVGWNGSIAISKPRIPIKVKINDSPIILNTAPVIINGKLLIPAKELSEQMDSRFVWNQATKTIKITRGKTNIVINIGSQTATVNNKKVKLECPAQIINGVEMVSAKLFFETLDARFVWNSDTNTISILKK